MIIQPVSHSPWRWSLLNGCGEEDWHSWSAPPFLLIFLSQPAMSCCASTLFRHLFRGNVADCAQDLVKYADFAFYALQFSVTCQQVHFSRHQSLLWGHVFRVYFVLWLKQVPRHCSPQPLEVRLHVAPVTAQQSCLVPLSLQ